MPLNNQGIQLRNRNVNQNPNNMNTNKGQVGTGQRIRLRRNVSKQQLIQKNLSHMQQSAQKKKVAQELYYNNQGSRSPLLRTNTVNSSRASVHNRLGHNSPPSNTNRKTVVRNQTDKRIKLRRQILQPDQIIRNNIVRRKNEKVKRLNSVQNRILRIRQNHQNQNRQAIQNRQANQNNATQKVHLRRMRPGPVNYTVQVSNNANKNRASFKHSVNSSLNNKLQQEIRLIQNKTVTHDEIPSIPIHPQGTGFTGTTLNERFSQL